MSFNTLSDQLAHASKKFSRACDQINILKQRIAELIRMFSYCDPNLAVNNQQASNPTEATYNSATYTTHSTNNFNVSIFKESIRQQIENLQSVKTAYLMYAHSKADEITRLQCELYGEEAVRVAYGGVASEAATSTSEVDQSRLSQEELQSQNETDYTNETPFIAHHSTLEPQPESHGYQESVQVNIYQAESSSRRTSENDNNNDQNYWTPWDFSANQDILLDDHTQFRQASAASSSQVQLIEYDFLTA